MLTCITIDNGMTPSMESIIERMELLLALVNVMSVPLVPLISRTYHWVYDVTHILIQPSSGVHESTSAQPYIGHWLESLKPWDLRLSTSMLFPEYIMSFDHSGYLNYILNRQNRLINRSTARIAQSRVIWPTIVEHIHLITTEIKLYIALSYNLVDVASEPRGVFFMTANYCLPDRMARETSPETLHLEQLDPKVAARRTSAFYSAPPAISHPSRWLSLGRFQENHRKPSTAPSPLFIIFRSLGMQRRIISVLEIIK